MFTQLNHECFSAITYIFLKLYFSYFEGFEEQVRPYLRCLSFSKDLKAACKKICKKKTILKSLNKQTLSVTDLISYILNYFKMSLSTGEQHELTEGEFIIYEQLMCIIWNSIFYIKLRQNNYDAQSFEKDLDRTVNLQKLEELTDEDGKSIESTQLIEMTETALINLAEEFEIPFPINHMFISKFARRLFKSKSIVKDGILTEEELEGLYNNLEVFMSDVFNIQPPTGCILWINVIWETHLSSHIDYTNTEELQSIRINWITIITILLKKVNSHKSKILKNRLISVDLLHLYKIPLEGNLNFKDPYCLKILTRLENSTILLPTMRMTKDLLLYYKNNFEKNTSILNVIINIFKCAIKLCNIFVSDGFFENIFRKEILEQAGRLRIESQLSQFSRPYTLRDTELGPREIQLVEVVKGFNADISEQTKRYLGIFKNHVREEKHFISSYSTQMKRILEEEIKIKMPVLNFDNDPISVEICMELQKFDKIAYANVCSVMRDKMDAWISEKLGKIRGVVDRCYEHEKLEVDPENKFLHSHSAIDLFKILFDTFDKLFTIVGEKFFSRWHKTILAMLNDVMFDYCSRLLDDFGDHYNFKKLFFLPHLSLKERKLSWPMLVSQRIKGKKQKIIFQPFYDEKFGIERICLAIGNLDYIRNQTERFKIRYLSESLSADKVLLTIDDYTNKIITVLATKLCYVEFAELIFNKLYFIDDTSDRTTDNDIVSTLEYELKSIDPIMETLSSRTSERIFNLLLPKLLTTFTELLIDYLKFYYQFVSYPELQEDTEMFKKEYQALLDYFADDEHPDGLTKKKAKVIFEPYQQFIKYVNMDEYHLSEEFKGASIEERQIISRILYRRKDKEADKFFNVYKSLIK